jgi:hypothetical protein
MSGAVISAGRRALAALVLLATGWLVVWLAAFRVGHFQYLSPKYISPAVLARLRCGVGMDSCYAVRPGWTIPVAVAIACVGIALAGLLYRGRPNWPLRPRVDDL